MSTIQPHSWCGDSFKSLQQCQGFMTSCHQCQCLTGLHVGMMNIDAIAIVYAPFHVKAEVTQAGHDAAGHDQQDRRGDRLRRSLLCLHSLRSIYVVSVSAELLRYSTTVLWLLCLAG